MDWLYLATRPLCPKYLPPSEPCRFNQIPEVHAEVYQFCSNIENFKLNEYKWGKNQSKTCLHCLHSFRDDAQVVNISMEMCWHTVWLNYETWRLEALLESTQKWSFEENIDILLAGEAGERWTMAGLSIKYALDFGKFSLIMSDRCARITRLLHATVCSTFVNVPIVSLWL